MTFGGNIQNTLQLVRFAWYSVKIRAIFGVRF